MGIRTAIVHEWLDGFAGSEQVVAHMLEELPDADLFALVDFFDEADRKRLGGRHAMTTFMQRLPAARRIFRSLLLLMPYAVEQLDVGAYDLVVSSHHAVAKGVITGPDQVHLSYVHSPMRYAWDLQHDYLRQANIERGLRSVVARYMLHKLRIWDVRTANGVDVFAANSSFIARRIWKIYRRRAFVIPPPVEVDRFPLTTDRDDHYVAVSRLVPYKRLDLAVDAFARMPARRLRVVGDGPQLAALRARATPNVTFLGRLPFEEMRRELSSARAFVFPALEDFGIVTVEAQACGTPVIAYGRGGSAEIVRDLEVDRDRPTGVLFAEQTVDAVVDAVEHFERAFSRFDAAACRAHAEGFGPARFRRQLRAVIDWSMENRRCDPDDERPPV